MQSKKSREVALEIDLRGVTLAETLDRVEKYLDDCVLAGLKRVSLIHGKGTGRLREGLHVYLKVHPQIASFRLGEYGEGGSGVTIVTFT